MKDVLAHHVIMRLADDRVLAPTVVQQRRLAATVMSMPAEFALLSFGAADSHFFRRSSGSSLRSFPAACARLHTVILCERCAAGRFARNLELRLRFALAIAVPFEPARIRPIESQSHLGSSFFYALRQESRHGIRLSPYHDANALPDLLGLRVGGAVLRERVARTLPRVTRQSLRDLLPANAFTVEPDLAHLEEATLSAFALPHLGGSGAEAIEARRAAIHAVGDALPARELSERLEVSIRTVRRLRVSPKDSGACYAVRAQLRLRTAIAVNPEPFL